MTININSSPDKRDLKFNATIGKTYGSIDLRNDCMPEVFNQGSTGSCTAQACVLSFWYQYNRMYKFLGTNIKFNSFSRMFAYYMGRWFGNNRNEDTGCSMRDMCKVLKKCGVTESRNYGEGMVFNTEPSFYALASAMANKIDAYYRADTVEAVIEALHLQIPVVFSTWFPKFGAVDSKGLCRNALTGFDTTYQHSNHAMVIVGYLKDYDYYGVKKDVFVIRNSWGTGFGDKGYFYIPVDQLFNFKVDEAWIMVKDKFTSDEADENYKKRVL